MREKIKQGEGRIEKTRKEKEIPVEKDQIVFGNVFVIWPYTLPFLIIDS
jgi:hypothetical protein